MASKTAATLLRSIEEELAILADEVESMQSKISLTVSQGSNSDEDVSTVVSLTGSECGSMESFEEFVHRSLPPPAIKCHHRSFIPSRIQLQKKEKPQMHSRIPRSAKKLSQGVPESAALLEAGGKQSWKIGTENYARVTSPESLSSTSTSSTAGANFKMSKIPGTPKRIKDASQVTSEGMAHQPKPPALGVSRLPKPPTRS